MEEQKNLLKLLKFGAHLYFSVDLTLTFRVKIKFCLEKATMNLNVQQKNEKYVVQAFTYVFFRLSKNCFPSCIEINSINNNQSSRTVNAI